jgi:hypothetical protein
VTETAKRVLFVVLHVIGKACGFPPLPGCQTMVQASGLFVVSPAPIELATLRGFEGGNACKLRLLKVDSLSRLDQLRSALSQPITSG